MYIFPKLCVGYCFIPDLEMRRTPGLKNIQKKKMKWLAIDSYKRDRASDSKHNHRQNKKRGKRKQFIKNENKQECHEHDNELARSNRANNLILDVDKLRDGKLLHISKA